MAKSKIRAKGMKKTNDHFRNARFQANHIRSVERVQGTMDASDDAGVRPLPAAAPKPPSQNRFSGSRIPQTKPLRQKIM